MKKITDGDLKKLIGVRGKPRLVPVGACLWLRVSINARGETSKRWLTRYYEKGKPIKRIIGSFPELSLAKAKALAFDLRSPIEPPPPNSQMTQLQVSLAKNVARLLEFSARPVESRLTFEDAAAGWLERKNREWAKSHGEKQRLRLESYLLPQLGSMAVAEISMAHIERVVEPLSNRGDTARRVFQIIRCVLQYARKIGELDDNSIFLDMLAYGRYELPKAGLGRHFYSGLGALEIGRLLLDLDRNKILKPGAASTALCLAPYVFVRPSELCGARWEEINFSEAFWHIPAQRMKMRRQHLVPLSRQALDILKTLGGGEKAGLVFRNSMGRPLVPESMCVQLRAMGYGYKQSGVTTHSFRGMASTILHQDLEYPPHLVELQMAHIETNKVKNAYDRINPFSFFERRKEMIQRYADHLDSLRLKAKNMD